MSKTLTLKPRVPGLDGRPLWHDYHVVSNALSSILKGKSVLEAALWFRVAGKIQQSAEAAGLGRKEGDREIGVRPDGRPILIDVAYLPPITLKLGNTDAHQLWHHLERLPAEQFGNGQMLPSPPGALALMLADIAAQLGENYAALDDDEKEDEKSQSLG